MRTKKPHKDTTIASLCRGMSSQAIVEMMIRLTNPKPCGRRRKKL